MANKDVGVPTKKSPFPLREERRRERYTAFVEAWQKRVATARELSEAIAKLRNQELPQLDQLCHDAVMEAEQQMRDYESMVNAPPTIDMITSGMEASVLGSASADDPAYVLSIWNAMVSARAA